MYSAAAYRVDSLNIIAASSWNPTCCRVQVDIVVSKIPVRSVIETAKRVLYTGHYGDGKIFVYDVENVVKIRTGEEGYDALQDEE